MSNEQKSRSMAANSRKRRRISKQAGFGLKRRLLRSEILEDRRMLFAAGMHAALADISYPDQSPSLLRPDVLQAVRQASIDLDATMVLESEDHFHGSNFSGSASRINNRYLEAVKAADPAALDLEKVAANFGRIIHAAQDFYAHSNWADLISGNYLAQGSLIESGLGYWNDLSPFSVQANRRFPHPGSGLNYEGVMLAEVPISLFQPFEPSNPQTPAGRASSIGKFTELVAGQGNRNIAWVEAGQQRFAAVVSGTFALQPDRTPDAADFPHSVLDKSEVGHFLHERAKELATAQTRHELLRLFKLVEDYWGTHEHLLSAWINEQNQGAFRELLSGAIENGRSMDRLAAEIRDGSIEQLTVITHGFQMLNTDGDSLMSLAQAIHHRSGGWLVDYDIPNESERGYFQLHRVDDRLVDNLPDGTSQERGSAILLFDWAAESNEMSEGWTEAAADALFAMLVDLGVLDVKKASSHNLNLHFIAHSFGSAVTSEAIERLGFHGVQVDQMTVLDPHDFDQGIIPVDGSQNQSSLGAIPDYGVTVWQNVSFADVYYQTEFAPDGRPIPGAVNFNVTDDSEVTALDFDAHSDVWNALYMKTVISPGSRNFGYRFASSYRYETTNISSPAPLSRPAAAFHQPPAGFGAAQDHQHTPQHVLTPPIADAFRAPIEWQPTLINGDFAHVKGPFEFIVVPVPQTDNIIPGWSHHGGYGTGVVQSEGGNHYLRLNANGPSRTHNAFYLGSHQGVIEFDLRIVQASGNDRLSVWIGNHKLASLPLLATSGFRSQRVTIPSNLRNEVKTLTLK
ncbi:MAG: hypothetical protein ACK5N9_05565 [Pirellula sp.]